MEGLGMNLASFYKNKKVLITGNTGFKGSWLTEILLYLEADVMGYSLISPTNPNLYTQLKHESRIQQIIADIRNFDKLNETFEQFKPEVVFHLAAQPLVLESYKNPRATYEINAMGTVNVLECARFSKSVKSIINVTTDKVYKNNEWIWGYRENDILDGFDPYSNSKSVSELITSTYIRSYFNELDIPVSTMRAGNVLGGGDYSDNRIIPDCIRALENKSILEIRNPMSVRPYQHVLEPLFAYLNVAKEQALNHSLASSYNIGPEESSCVETQVIVETFNKYLINKNLKPIEVEYGDMTNKKHEANLLMLDCSKYRKAFNWLPLWQIDKTIEKVVEFVDAQINSRDLNNIVLKQIKEYIGEINY